MIQIRSGQNSGSELNYEIQSLTLASDRKPILLEKINEILGSMWFCSDRDIQKIPK